VASIPFAGVHAGGYVFQIEMTLRASRAGARVVEVPITFRDRRVGQSKMSRRIVVEALVVVVRLRAEELVRRVRGGRVGGPPGSSPGDPPGTPGGPPGTTGGPPGSPPGAAASGPPGTAGDHAQGG
jgi:hypothetical protein